LYPHNSQKEQKQAKKTNNQKEKSRIARHIILEINSLDKQTTNRNPLFLVGTLLFYFVLF
jgi:hypothetical protein